jgi:hypothetical protein
MVGMRLACDSMARCVRNNGYSSTERWRREESLPAASGEVYWLGLGGASYALASQGAGMPGKGGILPAFGVPQTFDIDDFVKQRGCGWR